MTSVPTTLLLDLGGVVVDVDLERGALSLSRRVGVARTEFARVLFDSGLKDAMDLGTVSADDALRQACSSLGAGSQEDLRSAFGDILQVRPEVVAHINAIADRGTEVVVLSNADPIHAAWIQTHSELRVNRWIFSFQIGLLKPDPDAFRAALSVIGREAWDCVLLDDRLDNLASAAELGIAGVHYADSATAFRGLAALGLHP